MKKLRPGEMVQIKTVEELLGVVNEESAMDIEIYKIHSFQGHPFKVVDDDKMLELVESIKANGVLLLSGKLNDAPSGRLFRADFRTLQMCQSL